MRHVRTMTRSFACRLEGLRREGNTLTKEYVKVTERILHVALAHDEDAYKSADVCQIS